MKPITRHFIKYWLWLQLPIYGGYLWVFIQLGLSYWVAWALANTIYAFTVFPIVRRGIFELKGEK